MPAMSSKYLLVGLGNPGLKYRKTRHNVGWIVIDRLAKQMGSRFKKGRGPYEITEISIDNNSVILIKPLTFMNNSGQAVAEVVNYYNIELSRLLVILDEIELSLGRLRLRAQGSSGGHNGLGSIIQHLNTKMFARLRIGIGTEFAKKDMTKFVLSNFTRNEQKELDIIIDQAVDAVRSFIADGVDKAMNTINSL
ncbi:aminoacyl-tRNA hydrolase [candidate division KSB1 bacterium]|nr:MAG: aminoacyl-tRNA hydrolase [candidate division KSB1 bacterium]